MKISLHDYVTDPALPQRDGVNLAHENIAALMRACPDNRLDVQFHDFNRLLTDDDHARATLGDAACVISNVGPHAHYYFHLRERLGLGFRIFRDVRTAIWSSYLLQEQLCAPFLREGDVLMVSSHYTRAIYERIFPHLRQHASFRCYPLAVQFPPPPPRPPRPDAAPCVIGYLGRLSEDKNFPDLVQLLVMLNQARPGGFRMIACGDVHSPSCQPQLVSQQLAAALGPGDWFRHLPPRPHQHIWEVLGQFDVMLFPSTSNLETFGRVLIEASYAGVPVVCSAHAAAPELMPASVLSPVDYRQGEWLSAHYDHNMGRTSITRMAEILLGGPLPLPDSHKDYLGHPEKFIRALSMTTAEIARLDPLHLEAPQAQLVQGLTVSLPPLPDKQAASTLIDRLLPWFIGLQQGASPSRAQLLARLAALSPHGARTARFAERTAHTRCDFTNVGAIDIELCNVADFHPLFSFRPG